jgi:hypothetical protein
MSNKEGEKFGGANNADDEALQKEMNAMLSDVENKEVASFEESGRGKLLVENKLINKSIFLMNDIIVHEALPSTMSLNRILDALDHKDELEEFVMMVSPQSIFYNNIDKATSFMGEIRRWINEKVLGRGMSLFDAMTTLDEKQRENNELLAQGKKITDEKMDRDQQARERENIERVCTAIDHAVHGIATSWDVKRTKNVLKAKLTFHDSDEAVAFVSSLPGIQASQRRNEITFSALFNETLLDEMEKRYSWIY